MTATSAIADNGAWSGPNLAKPVAPTPTPASASGNTQQQAAAMTPPSPDAVATPAAVVSENFIEGV
jgi:hypothetical protein